MNVYLQIDEQIDLQIATTLPVQIAVILQAQA